MSAGSEWNRDRTRAFVVGLAVVAISSGYLAGCDKGPGKTDPSVLVVNNVFPNVGPAGSAVDVRIHGAGFQAGATVTVDGAAATNVSVVSATLITARTPAHAAGLVELVVTNPNGDHDALPGAFTFVTPAPPAVSGASPNVGLVGDTVRIMGNGFKDGATVTFGGSPAPNLFVSNSTLIFIQAPSHAPGLVDVAVTNPDGQVAALAAAFRYQTLTLTASADSVAAGGALSVSWVAPGARPAADWIAIFKVGAPPEDYDDLWWAYTNGAATGTLTLTAPAQPGQYEFRYFADDSFGVAAQTGVVVVTPPAPAPAEPLTVKAPTIR